MKKRKILAYLLSLTLMMTSMPAQFFAAQVDTQSNEMYVDLTHQTTTESTIGVEEPDKYIGDGYEVAYKTLNQSDTSFIGEIELTNTGTYQIRDWTLQFDFDYEITNIQNAEIIEHDQGQYIIKAVSETNSILPNTSVTIQIEATYEGEIQPPMFYIMDEEINYEDYPEDKEAYRKWKENILKKENQKNNKLKRYAANALVEDNSSKIISNDYLMLNYSKGLSGLCTTGGDPDNPYDNNKRLVYNGSSDNYTTIRIDGVDYVFYPYTVQQNGNMIIGTEQIGDVIVSEHVGIVSNPYTNRDDIVELYYTVENTSDVSHEVGVRIMFDTMLGDNDNAPFRLPAIGDVTTETDLSGDEIPEFWQAFDSLENPSIIAQGTLKVDKESTPDKVKFTNWSVAYGNKWEFDRQEGIPNGDGTICIYWNEKTLSPDNTFSCKTYYGLSSMQQDAQPPLALAVTGATKLDVVKDKNGKEEYSPNPFTVTAYVQNIGSATATNTNITLNLPSGMEVIDGNKKINLGDLPEGTRQYMVSWKVKAGPSTVDKVQEYSVTLVADNAEAKTLTRSISIPKVQTSQIKLLLDRNSIRSGNMLCIKFKLVNEGDQPVDLSKLFARYYYNDENVNIEKVTNCDDAKCENPYQAVKQNIIIKSKQNITPTLHNANAFIQFEFGDKELLLQPKQEVIVSSRVNETKWGNMIVTNDYSYRSDIQTNNGYVEWNYMPVYLKSDVNLPIYGIQPAQEDLMNVEGTYYAEGKVVSWAHLNGDSNSSTRDPKYNISLLGVNIENSGNKVTLKGKLSYAGKEKEITFSGNMCNNYDVEESTNIFGERTYFLLDDTEDYEVLSCSIEKNATCNWLQVENMNLMGKNIFRLNLKELDTGAIIELEGEWKLDNSILETSSSASDEEMQQVTLMNKWFVDYVEGLYDTDWSNRDEELRTYESTAEEDCNLVPVKASSLVRTYNVKSHTYSYVTANGTEITLDKSAEELPYYFDCTLLETSGTNEVKVKTFYDGESIRCGNNIINATYDGGYNYIIVEYPANTTSRYIEILNWAISDGFNGWKANSEEYNLGITVLSNVAYKYRPKLPAEYLRYASGDPNVDKNMLYAAASSSLQGPDYSTMDIRNISIIQKVMPANGSGNLPYFKSVGISAQGYKVNKESKGNAVFILADKIASRVPGFSTGYGIVKDTKEVIEALIACGQEMKYQKQGEYITNRWDINMIKDGHVQYSIENNRYKPELYDEMVVSAKENNNILKKANDYYMASCELNMLQLVNSKAVTADYKTNMNNIAHILKEGYKDDGRVFPEKIRLRYVISFDIYREGHKCKTVRYYHTVIAS